MIYTLQQYSNKISYCYLSEVEGIQDNDIITEINNYEWNYDIYLMSDMTLCIDITAITPDNRYSIRQTFTHTFIYQVQFPIKYFAQMTIERMINELGKKYKIKIHDNNINQKLIQLFIKDFCNVFQSKYFNYYIE